MIWNEILCLGDSLTYGARDCYGRSYPVELGQILYKETGELYVCHNYGVNGETTADLLRRSWSILKSNRECKIALLLIGTNDTKRPTPLEVYEDNMRQLIMSIKANGMKPIVGTLPPLTFSPAYAQNREYTKKYSEIIKKMSVASRYNFDVCNLQDLGSLLLDGVQLDNNGYKEVAKRFSESILMMT